MSPGWIEKHRHLEESCLLATKNNEDNFDMEEE